jgi:uncharacterized membrane-anchored protein
MAAVFGVIGVALFALARLWRARAEPVVTQPIVQFRPAAVESLLSRLRPHATAVLVTTYALQLGTIGWMVWHHGKPAREGVRVLVSVEPVDPRDWMRGDYVILGYAFAGLNGGRFDPVFDRDWERSLAKDYWSQQTHVPRFHERLPEDALVFVPYTVGPNGVLKPGKLTAIRPTAGNYLTGRWGNPSRGVQARFGIEAYFVKEGTGKALEKFQRDGLLLAEIGVLPDGRAGLIDLRPDPAPMQPLEYQVLKGWKLRENISEWVLDRLYANAKSFEADLIRDGTPETPLPDFKKYRVARLKGDPDKSVRVMSNGNLVRITVDEPSGKNHLLLLIPAGDEPVYGPPGRLSMLPTP